MAKHKTQKSKTRKRSRVKKVKDGIITTEFALAAATIVAMVFGVPVSPEVAATVIGSVASIYTVVRGWVKTR